MPDMIIGSPNQNLLAVNNSGAVPIAGYSGTTIYPLLVDSTGKLETTATVAGVTVGSESFIYGKSGTGWVAALVDSTGKLETTATVTVDRVYVASGADIGSVYLKDGGFVSIITSGTTGVAVSGVVTADVNNASTIGSYTTQTVDGTITVSNLATAGSLAVQTVDAVDLDIRDLASGNDSVTAVQGTQANLKSEVYQGTDPWIILGSVNVDDAYVNVAASGTTGIPISGVISTNILTSPVQISGDVTISNDNFINVASSGTEGMEVSQARGTFGFSGATLITSGTVSNIITPGAGSKILLKGFNASAETATQFRLMFSGGDVISTFTVPASGTIAMNMLGMEPSGAADEPIGVGLFNAGSLHLSVYTGDIL